MIYIAAHKAFSPPSSKEGYVPLQVGASGKAHLGFITDDTGDNISEKNPYYCELTGLYWIWKNTSDKYIGLAHYRRYMGKTELSSSYRKVYDEPALIEFLKKADIVLPEKEYYKTDAKVEIIEGCTTAEVFDQLRNSVSSVSPDYLKVFDDFFSQNAASQYNMFFCKREVFEKYCEWLFPILFDLEKYIDMDKLKGPQKRVYGYLAERLLNIWVMHNGLKVKYVNTIQMEMKPAEKVNLMRRRITNRIRFALKKAVQK